MSGLQDVRGSIDGTSAASGCMEEDINVPGPPSLFPREHSKECSRLSLGAPPNPAWDGTTHSP